MIKCEIIGRIGANAEIKDSNGRIFTTFRVAHKSVYRNAQGATVSDSVWVDCIMNGQSAVNEYLVKGQQVYVCGDASLRVYSSKKDRCMKAGLTINVRQVELIGNKPDAVPAKLFDAHSGEEINVIKYFAMDMEDGKKKGNTQAISSSGEKYYINENGWISKLNTTDDI